MDCAQKLGFVAAAFPIFQDADRAPVGEGEAFDVDGVGGRVLAAKGFERRAAEDVAAGINAHVTHAFDVRFQIVGGGWTDFMGQPHGESGRHPARDLIGREFDASGRAHPDAVLPSAAFGNGLVGDGRGVDQRRGDNGGAVTSVGVERCEPEIKKPTCWLVEVQRCERAEALGHETQPQGRSEPSREHGEERQAGT